MIVCHSNYLISRHPLRQTKFLRIWTQQKLHLVNYRQDGSATGIQRHLSRITSEWVAPTATAGQLASLVKDSSLLSVLAVNEFTKAADTINSKTYATFEAYIPIAFGYLALTIPISLVAARLERRFRFET